MDADQELSKAEASGYRSVAARINCVAQDRHELLLSPEEICRYMATPTAGTMQKVNIIGRYLTAHPRECRVFQHQELPTTLEAIVDRDWAGCQRTRQSTSGGLLRFEKHILRAWTSTQAIIALSSGEAEYYALLKGVSTAFGMRSLMNGMAVYPETLAKADISAATGVAGRRGLGKTRHIDVCYLWLQEKSVSWRSHKPENTWGDKSGGYDDAVPGEGKS